MEIEAKMAAFLFLKEYMPERANVLTNSWTATFWDYYKKPNEDNYKAMINYLRIEEKYPEEKFPEIREFRDFDLLDNIFKDCIIRTPKKSTDYKN